MCMGIRCEDVTGSTEHADYPHNPGELYDCPACEETCFCEELAGEVLRDADPILPPCVACNLANEEFEREAHRKYGPR